MLKSFAAALLLTIVAQPVLADEPDGLKLPFGFHAQVVDEGTGPGARHIAVKGGHLYISTRKERGATTEPGVIAMDITGDELGELIRLGFPEPTLSPKSEGSSTEGLPAAGGG